MTTAEAVKEVLSHLSDSEKQQIENTHKNKLFIFNDGLGIRIRNQLGLWAYFKGKEDSILHPDWESFFIIEGIWEKLQNDRL